MSAFSARFDWDSGLVWQIGVAPVSATLNDMTKGTMHVCPALVDTGASQTCIARSVVNALGLQSISRAEVETVAGHAELNMYDVHVALPVDSTRNPDGSYDIRATVFRDMRVSEFAAREEGPYQALIGRDILRIGLLTLSPDGHSSFAF